MVENDICRLCSSSKSVNNVIFDEETKLYIKMALYLPIKVFKNDKLPQKVCDLCSCKVNDLYIFCKTAIEVQERLESALLEITNTQEIATQSSIDKNTDPLLQTDADENVNKLDKNTNVKEEPLGFTSNQIVYIKNEFNETDYNPNNISFSDEQNGLNSSEKQDTKTVTVNELKMQIMSRLEGETEGPITETGPEQQECQKEMLICGFPPPELLSVRKCNISQSCNDDLSLDKELHVCSTCNKAFHKLSNLIRHQKIHSTARQYECRECGKRFSHYYRLEWHKEIVHSGKKPYVCATCNKGFSTRSNLIRHEKIHAGIRPFACAICKKAFVDAYKLDLHKKTVHSGEKRFRCSRCNRAFGQRGHLAEHERTHYNIRPFDCNKCGKTFSMRSNLKRHLKMHADSKRYFCPFCKMAYKKRSQLIVHERTHTGERPYECDMCGVTTASKGEIKVHVWKHMGHDSQACETCGKAFMFSSELRIHELVHAQEKPYVCPICNKSFNKKSNLSRHERIHNAEDRPFKCFKCEKGFRDRSNLNRHLRDIHNHQGISHDISERNQTPEYMRILSEVTIKLEPTDF